MSPFSQKKQKSQSANKKPYVSKTHLLNCNSSTKVNLSFGAYIGVAFVQIVLVTSALSYISHVPGDHISRWHLVEKSPSILDPATFAYMSTKLLPTKTSEPYPVTMVC
jgi:hypothetical protein